MTRIHGRINSWHWIAWYEKILVRQTPTLLTKAGKMRLWRCENFFLFCHKVATSVGEVGPEIWRFAFEVSRQIWTDVFNDTSSLEIWLTVSDSLFCLMMKGQQQLRALNWLGLKRNNVNHLSKVVYKYVLSPRFTIKGKFGSFGW